jgi:serine/threonine protein kinase
MELCTGGDFRKWLNGGSKAEDPERDIEGIEIFKQIVSALFFLHSSSPSPIVHRDIKPENIFLLKGRNGGVNAKLGDFGLAREVSTEDMTSRRGTPYYKAPELVSAFADKP